MRAEGPSAPAEDLPREVEVAVVGAGFGGLGTAIQLKRAGIEDFVVLERAADLGGTWWANSYPGCQCDVPSNLYSFSFAPRPDWTHSYPMQGQILDYLRDCARRFDVLGQIRFHCEVLEASWRPDERRWHVRTSQGELSARVLVAAPGLLSEPSVPQIPGLENFRGTTFHSAAWDHDHDLTGERVALFGTGATGVQIAPCIQPEVGQLHIFQRTPAWVLPHFGRPVGPRVRRAYRAVPALQRLARAGVYAIRELFVLGMALRPQLMKLGEVVARLHLRRQVSDPALRRKLVPRYALGCKRLLLSNAWYPTLTAPNVELVTDRLAEVREHSVLTADGIEREVDTIVLATGFTPTDPPLAKRLRGRDGRTLAEVWQGSPQAYLGTTVAGFPNLFLLYGPNLNLGHTSIVYMLEAQIDYLLGALKAMRERDLAALEVRPAVQDAWNDEMQDRLAGTVWDSGGCSSWYLDRHGRNSVMWPGFTFEFRRRTRRFALEDYAAEPGNGATPSARASAAA